MKTRLGQTKARERYNLVKTGLGHTTKAEQALELQPQKRRAGESAFDGVVRESCQFAVKCYKREKYRTHSVLHRFVLLRIDMNVTSAPELVSCFKGCHPALEPELI